MNKLSIIFILSLFILSQTFAQSDAKLCITVSGIQTLKGEMYAAVFQSNGDFPNGEDYLRSKHVPVRSQEVTLSFSLEPGTYAISVYQDLDNDQHHDKNFMGIPKEPFCFSNNYRPKISSPNFQDCAIVVSKGTQTIRLHLVD